jgi:hypothetical protein
MNLYAEPMPEGAGASFALKAVPGLGDFADMPGVFVRSLINAPRYDDDGVPSDRLAAISDATLHEVDGAGVVTALGAVPDDERTGLSTNNGAITVTAGGRYFVWTGTALTEPTPGVFDGFGGVEFLGDYTILTERNDRRFCWSALADATDLPALNFATAEARDDAILRPLVIGGNLWLFKGTSIEIWGATGLAGAAAFQRLAVVETGLRDFNLLAGAASGAFFVGNDGIVYLTGGTPSLQPISTPAVNEAIARGEPTHALYYEHRGHKFCVVRFRGRPAFCYDLATGLWHERATGENGAFDATGAARAFGQWHFCGFNGAIRTASGAATDAGETLFRRAVSVPLSMGGKRFLVPEIEVFADMASGASLQMRLSRDVGRTWGTWRAASLGALGRYDNRVVFRSNGQARRLMMELRVTDAADVVLWSAAKVEAG